MKFLCFANNVNVGLAIWIIRAKNICNFSFCDIIKMEDHPTENKLRVFLFGRFKIWEVLRREYHSYTKHTSFADDIAERIEILIKELVSFIYQNHST